MGQRTPATSPGLEAASPKGDLLRYYATVAPLILPVVADRPLVMKRFPNGVDDRVAFYQQRRQKEQPPAGVRIEALPDDLDPVDEPGADASSAARS